MVPETENDNLFSDHILIVKGRFKSNSLNLYGILLIILNQNQKLDTYNIVVSTYSSVYDHEPHISWDQYEQAIMEMKWKGNFNASMTSSLMDQFKNIESDNELTAQIYNSINNYDYDNIDIFFFDMINRIIHDKNLILETSIQEVTLEEFVEAKEKRYDNEDQNDSSPVAATDLEEGSVMLTVQPILAPVKGKPIYELKVGDTIMTKIIPNTDRANYFIDLLELRVENHVKPVSCEVIDIKSNGKNEPIEILTRIGPGIYGKCIEDERQVKLRLYDPAIDGPRAKQTAPPKESRKAASATTTGPGQISEYQGFSKMTYVIIGLFAVLLIIFMLLIYISF